MLEDEAVHEQTQEQSELAGNGVVGSASGQQQEPADAAGRHRAGLGERF